MDRNSIRDHDHPPKLRLRRGKGSQALGDFPARGLLLESPTFRILASLFARS